MSRSVYRCNNPHLPVHELIIDPFESPFRPSQRIQTHDRVNALNSSQLSAEQPNKSDLSVDDEIKTATPSALNRSITLEQFPQSLKTLSQDYEIEIIQSALSHCQFNQKKTAEAP